LHIVDASSEHRDANIEQVNQVLDEIGAKDRPQLVVYNKIDLLDKLEPRLERDEAGRPCRVWVSAVTGAGLESLLAAIDELLHTDIQRYQLNLPPEAGRLHARLYEYGIVLKDAVDSQGHWLMQVELRRSDWEVLNKRDHIEQFLLPPEVPPRLAAAGEAP
jgi:GTP-binding protein HflX